MRYLFQLLHAWWRSDRVRASPRDGRWLRLARGSIVIVDGRPAEVRSRVAITVHGLPGIAYRCRTAAGDFFSLRAMLNDVRGTADITLISDAGERSVPSDEIELFA